MEDGFSLVEKCACLNVCLLGTSWILDLPSADVRFKKDYRNNNGHHMYYIICWPLFALIQQKYHSYLL
jgi:hypothetical protein